MLSKDEILKALSDNKDIDINKVAEILGGLTEEEQQWTIQMLREQMDKGKSDTLERMYSIDFIRKPVDIETFVKDPFYLGHSCDGIYPVWMDELNHMFRPGSDTFEWILTGSIRGGKCLSGKDLCYDTKNGRRRSVAELGEFSVPSMTEKDQTIAIQQCSSFASGSKPCIRVTTTSGKAIHPSDDHPIYTPIGWINAGDLKVGDYVATPRRLPPPETTLDISDDEVKFVAYLMADGGCTSSNTFTNELDVLHEEFEESLTALGGHLGRVTKPSAATTVSVVGVNPIVKKWGLKKKSIHKRLPAEFYGLSDRHVKLFLNRFWSCDGWLNLGKPYQGRRPKPVIETCLASELLIDDLQFLLLRLGIHANKRYKRAKCNGKWFDSWRLTIAGEDNCQKFLDEIGDILGKEDYCKSIRDAISSKSRHTSNDVIPIGQPEMTEIHTELGKPIHFREKWGCPGKTITRERFQRMVLETGYTGKYSHFAFNDLRWEKIKSVEDIGVLPVYDLTVPETGNFVCNNIVVHNTYAASVALTYKLYVLSCTKNPQTFLGLGDPNTAIYFGIFSVRLAEAEETAFDYIKNFVDSSPYFKKYFPRNKKINYRLEFPNRIKVNFGSKELHALGRAMICVIIDEANFMKGGALGEAFKLYYQIRARITGQYQYRGYTPGLLCVVSSRNTETDFLEKHMATFAGQKGVHISEYALWETRPPDYYTGDTFRVAVGNKFKPSKILRDGERNPKDQTIIDVPVEHKLVFENNIDKAICDVAGLPLYAISNYLQDRTKLLKCSDGVKWTHPFTFETIELDYADMPRISDYFKIRDVCKVVGSRYAPKINPDATRFAHVDLALNGDAAGIAVTHVAGMRHEKRQIRDALYYDIAALEVNVDFVLRIKAASGGEIDISAIREFFLYLRRNGYRFGKITYDGYQSASSIQDLNKAGLKAELQSVDRKTDAYDCLKDMLMEERLHMYHFEPFIDEIGQLQRTIRGKYVKIDHPPDGSKDCADAVAGAVFSAIRDRTIYPNHRDKPVHVNTMPKSAFAKKVKTNDGYITGVQQGEDLWDF